MDEIDPKNLSAQLHYRARGNPPSSLPSSAIGNCFPGLEFDFRAIWRRILVGLELHEARPQVIRVDDAEPAEIRALEGQFLFTIDGEEMLATRRGPTQPGGPPQDMGLTGLEWTNALANVARKGGRRVQCVFFDPRSNQTTTVEREVRSLFARGEDGGELPVLDAEAALPGELTQGLCSPWQNDYLECACYYWAASRPDFVNAEERAGETVGHNWLHRDRDAATPLGYSLRRDDLVTYEELFRGWEQALGFIVGGRDEE